MRTIGSPRKVIDLYHQALSGEESDTLARRYSEPSGHRWGTGDVEIARVRLMDATGQERYVYEPGEAMSLRLSYKVHRLGGGPAVFGFAITRADGVLVYGTNTQLDGLPSPALGEQGEVIISLSRLDLVDGGYFIDVAVHSPDGVPYDYRSRCYPLSVRSGSKEQGLVRIAHSWRIEPGTSLDHTK